MGRRYDLVVLGGGTAGLIASLYAARVGARVALVEQAEQPGASARLAHDMRTADMLGPEPSEPSVDFARVMDRIQEVIRRAGVRDTAEYLESEGVEVMRAFGRFAPPGVVEAEGRDLRFRAAIIATGSRPAVPPITGLEGADFLTNETVIDLRELPPRMTVLGGGPCRASSVGSRRTPPRLP